MRAAVRGLLLGYEELAVLDVREELDFGAEHLLYASCLPLSRLEFLAAAMLRRRNVPIVLCDGGEGLAERAATRLHHFGYDNVRVLEGGTGAWKAAGFELFRWRQRAQQGLRRVHRARVRYPVAVGARTQGEARRR